MGFEEFRRSLSASVPPAEASPMLQALWHEGKGDWARAHELAQTHDDSDGAWVHAYLHRREGDLPNADYWYRRAGRSRCRSALDEEWEAMVTELLAREMKSQVEKS